MKTKILFIASEFAPGMIPFASTIITTLNRDERFDVYALVVNSGNKSYAVTLGDMSKEHLLQIEYPQNKIIKLFYKFFPISVIMAIKRLEKKIKPEGTFERYAYGIWKIQWKMLSQKFCLALGNSYTELPD